ncbi:MAG TPA: tripartite tricarboxylate transporter TctB family protein [Microvirga sp.]|jgi:putative tricarboxylic transport membrane protein|nr:tripartite tricarboxylate transporter TctB family protein [Microvirga sp.]
MTPSARHRVDPAGLAIAAILLALALLVFWDTSRLELNAVYGVGPRAMPYLVAGGLAVLALGNAVLAFQGALPARESIDFTALLLILGGLAALIALIGLGGGFIPATAVLFAAVATAFGRRAILTDLLIGLGLGLATYLLFAKLLALTLPVGPLERLL